MSEHRLSRPHRHPRAARSRRQAQGRHRSRRHRRRDSHRRSLPGVFAPCALPPCKSCSLVKPQSTRCFALREAERIRMDTNPVTSRGRQRVNRATPARAARSCRRCNRRLGASKVISNMPRAPLLVGGDRGARRRTARADHVGFRSGNGEHRRRAHVLVARADVLRFALPVSTPSPSLAQHHRWQRHPARWRKPVTISMSCRHARASASMT